MTRVTLTLCSPAVLVDSEVKSRILVDGSDISDHYAIAVDVIIPADGCLRDLRVTKSTKFCWDRADMSQYTVKNRRRFSYF